MRFLKDSSSPKGRGPRALGGGRRPLCLKICLALLAVVNLHPVACQIVLPKFHGLPSMDKLAAENGMSISHMLVQTEDGYVLMMHRLGNNSGPPVLLMHGLFAAADIWLVRGRKTDLVYFLLEEGYDVYLGNKRGNAFSKRHVKFKTNDILFWDFSFHEVGYYDVPAMINKILDLRKTDQLFYIGHSLGATVFFVTTSIRPEYNAKIRAAVLLGPVAQTPDHDELAISLGRLLIANRETLYRSLYNAGWMELMPRRAGNIKAAYDFCDYKKPTQDYCLDIMGLLLGENRSNLDRKRLAYVMSFVPAGSSVKMIYHYMQLYQTSKFDYLDLGEETNMKLYNSSKPPSYPLEKITAPTALFWSYNDIFLSKTIPSFKTVVLAGAPLEVLTAGNKRFPENLISVKRIRSQLRNVVLDKANPDPKFTHADPITGLNAKETLYDDIIETLNKFR